MRLINYLNNHFNSWREYAIQDESKLTLKEMRLIYLVDVLMDMTTYDDSLSIEFGEKILEIMNVIYKEENFEYFNSSKNHYVSFIIVANLLNDCNMLNWGGSIRGCWFEYDNFIKFPGLDIQFKIKEREEYTKIIAWLNGEDIKIDDEEKKGDE